MRIDGNLVAKDIETSLIKTLKLFKTISVTPEMAVILVGNRPDSELYVNLKQKKCIEMGIKCHIFKFEESSTEEQIISHINKLNANNSINGILVQLPLPKHMNEYNIVNTVSYTKDIDGFHDYNIVKSFSSLQEPLFFSCTPKAILTILDFYKINIESKLVCIVGPGRVGKMVGNLLLQQNATIMFINETTINKQSLVQQADIVIACCGSPLLIKEDWIKENAFVIDVGINRINDPTTKTGYKTVGDVDYKNVIKKANVNFLTVGPVTIMMLLQQLVDSFIRMNLENNILYRGKVRNLYLLQDNKLIIETSDRLSAFNKHQCFIKNKGKFLNEMSAWWFNKTKHIIQNHYIDHQGKYMLVHKTQPIKLEIVVRGYITGSLWKEYEQGNRSMYGLSFPDGMIKNEKLPYPIITPTLKNENDDVITHEEIIKQNILSKKDFNFIKQKSLELFNYGQTILNDLLGLTLVDTKYEFGFDEKNNIILIDEIHTCDSSRFWSENNHFDKQIIRDWLSENPNKSIPNNIKDRVEQIYKNYATLLMNL